MKPPFANGPMERLIPKQDALAALLENWKPCPGTESVPLSEAAGRVLAEDIYARYSIPVVRASAMDGVAIAASSLNGAPDTASWRLGQEYCRADTGDDFDDRYDTVIAIEQVRLLPEGGLAFAEGLEIKQGMNVRPSGSQLPAGTLIRRAGARLTALDAAAIAMGGHSQATVVRRPRIAFVPTGSELVPVGSELQRGQNFEVNSLMAGLLLQQMGAEPVLCPIHRDDPAAIRQTLEQLLPSADIVILNAGTSKGQEDYCSHLLAERGRILFQGVAAVPGRPMTAAIVDDKLVLNISGPTLAAFYSLDWAVRPLAAHFLGVPPRTRPQVQVTLTAPLHSPPHMSLLCMLRLKREGDRLLATPLALRGPGAASAAEMLTADALYATVPGQGAYAAGDVITAELLRDPADLPG